jgi:DNA-binding MarR family transcriptional regulator
MSKPKGAKPYQQDMFQAETRFFLMLSSLFSDTNEKGETRAAEIGPYGVMVLLALRRSADFDTGLVQLGQREIARQTGMRQGTVKDYLKKLVKLGYVEKINDEDPQQRGLYRLTDHISLEHREEHAGEMLVPYSPRKMSGMLSDVKKFLKDGRLPETAKAAGIQVNITLNITNIQHAENVFLGTREDHAQSYEAALSLPDGIGKETALRAIRSELEKWEQQDENEGIWKQLIEAREQAERTIAEAAEDEVPDGQ